MGKKSKVVAKGDEPQANGTAEVGKGPENIPPVKPAQKKVAKEPEPEQQGGDATSQNPSNGQLADEDANPQNPSNGQLAAGDEKPQNPSNGHLAAGDENGSDAGAEADPMPNSPGKKKKNKKKKAKKFVPLPSFEHFASRLKWKVAFTQAFGRHAVALQDLAPGEVLLRESACAVVPRIERQQAVCFSCLIPLSAAPTAHQVEYKPLEYGSLPEVAKRAVDRVRIRQYCSAACKEKDSLATTTLPVVYAAAPLADERDFELDFLNIAVELDARRSKAATARAPEPEANGNEPSEEGTEGGAERRQAGEGDSRADAENTAIVEHGRHSEMKLITCGIGDAEVLNSLWDRQTAEWRKVVYAISKEIHDQAVALDAYTPSTPQQIAEMCAIVKSNAHGCGAANAFNVDLGFGLFPVLSLLNHNCGANCIFTCTGLHMEVRAIRPIHAGEPLTVTYVNAFEPRAERKRVLLVTRHFVCRCERCTAPLETSTDRFLEAAICQKDGCGGLLLACTRSEGGPGGYNKMEDKWECLQCHQVESAHSWGDEPSKDGGPADVVDWAKEMWQGAREEMRKKDYVRARQMLEEVRALAPSRLHPLHVVVFDSLMPLVNCCRAMDDIQAAITYLRALIKAMDELIGGTTVELGNLEELLGGLLERRSDQVQGAPRQQLRKQAKEAYNRSAAHRKITLGEDSAVTKATLAKARLVRL